MIVCSQKLNVFETFNNSLHFSFKMSEEYSLSELSINPLGSYSDLKPSFKRQVKALFKKQILQKIRKKSAIIEIIIAFLLVIISWVAFHFSTTVMDANEFPVEAPLSSELIMWFSMYSDTHVILMRTDPLMTKLFNNTKFLKMGTYGGTYDVDGVTYSFRGADLQYLTKYKDVEDVIYSTESNGIAIDWTNIGSADMYTNPVFKVYHQSTLASPQRDVFLELRDALIKLRYQEQNSDNYDEMISKTVSLNTNLNELAIANSEKKTRMSGIALNVAFITALSVIISSMPDMEKIFEEKDNHVNALSFMMGMKESAFWFTNFITPIIINFLCYLMIALCFCYSFVLVGSNFWLVFIVFMLYVLSEICFQFFVSTFMNKGTSGRSLTVILIVLCLVMGFLHQFLTLDTSSHNDALTHIFCIIPISAFEVFVMQGYKACSTGMPPFSWSNLHDRVFLCQPWIPMLWLGIDTVLYFVLFIIFNAVMPRPFGNPMLKVKELFTKEGWMKLFGKKTNEMKIGNDNDLALGLENVTMKYNKKTKAIDDVSFDVKRGEVIVMIGPNGAGKSTLINLIAGAIHPNEGEVVLHNGLDQHNIGVCFQDNVIINELSVREHFELFGAYRGISPEVLNDSIEYFAANMQLSHMMNNRAGDLSGGQKRKLCIGLSLLGNPAIVLMDEPTAGVDVQARQLIWKMISGLKYTTSIVTSHALEEAEAVSSRLFIVAAGKVPFTGTSTEMREKYKCGYKLRVDRDDGTVGPVFDLAKSYVSDSTMVEDRKDTILIPVNKEIVNFIEEFSKRETELGVKSYSFQVEQIEDMLVKLIQAEEVKNE